MTARIAINGFGRIGRASYKIAFDKPGVEIVAINDLTDPKILAHLLKYDSAYGRYEKDIKTEESTLIVDGKKTKIFAEKDPEKLPWKDLNVDVVLECTGRFTENDTALAHIRAGAKKVIISAPTKGGTAQTFLIGVNDDQYLGQNIISNASCTTNCISPVVKAIHQNLKILKSTMTTVHAITAEQNLVDGPPPPLHPDLRRARAAGYNMVPTTTGAAKATTKTIPELEGLFDGISIRVPIITGSLSDLTMLVSRKTTVEEVNKILTDASKDPKYKNVMAVTNEPLVSSDIIKTPYD